MNMTTCPASDRTDYELVTAAIAILSRSPARSADLDGLAAGLGVSNRHLTALFKRWAGLTPTAFAHCVTLDHARRLLADSATVLDTANELGLSSAGRLYDLFVTHEAMPPGIYKAKGEGLSIRFGFHPSPFGSALVMITDYGLAAIGFSDGDEKSALKDMKSRWPRASYTEEPAMTAPYAARAFDPARWQPDQPLRITLIGSDFQISVWETLLSVPPGRAVTYSGVAAKIGRPKAVRAVGAAVGRNPISFVVPCHRVLGKNAALTGYHWGLMRKQAILGWEAGLVRS
ncbi:MAG: methylated-DNA--[protein]-cysteine S-methyltransferase [Alphaproteobacteria bacterium]|nr:methylated-DNA--[protein]-cysteine S-methyltransferase [Alphaproteobacteria bacterium]